MIAAAVTAPPRTTADMSRHITLTFTLLFIIITIPFQFPEVAYMPPGIGKAQNYGLKIYFSNFISSCGLIRLYITTGGLQCTYGMITI